MSNLVSKRGTLSFIGSGVHSRTDQVFISFTDKPETNPGPWETPLGFVDEAGMNNLDTMTMYGDFSEVGGNGPDPDRLRLPDTKQYLETHFKDMDYIKFCHAELPVDAHGDEVQWEL